MTPPRLHILTTIPMQMDAYLSGQPRFLANTFDVTLVSGGGLVLDRIAAREGVRAFVVSMTRRIAPLSDTVALFRLYRLFRQERPHIVQTYTPKAGLLGMMAASLARVPVRVHGIVGLPLMEARGAMFWVNWLNEHLTYWLATDITCNSRNLQRWIRKNLSRRDIRVVAGGSINGIDTASLQPASQAEKREARRRFNFENDHFVVTFIGRMVRDKGVNELLSAFAQIHDEHPRVRLLFAGETDSTLSPLSKKSSNLLECHPGIVQAGWVDDVRPVLAATDILVLPSYREGLPNVLLEAAAMQIPVVASDINGCDEVVVNRTTGLLIPAKDEPRLRQAIIEMSVMSDLLSMGVAGRKHMQNNFEHSVYCLELERYYRGLLLAAGCDPWSDSRHRETLDQDK